MQGEMRPESAERTCQLNQAGRTRPPVDPANRGSGPVLATVPIFVQLVSYYAAADSPRRSSNYSSAPAW